MVANILDNKTKYREVKEFAWGYTVNKFKPGQAI